MNLFKYILPLFYVSSNKKIRRILSFEIMRVTMKYEINRVRVANEIKEIRLSLGLTMEDFANKLGVAKGTVNNYEKGRILPGESVIRKLFH